MRQTNSNIHNTYTPAFNPVIHTNQAHPANQAHRPQIFEHPAFGQLRAVRDTATGQPLFVGKDVALALGYSIPHKAITTHCKGYSKMELPTRGGQQKMIVIPESDLYRLIMASKLPAAQKYADWVFEEVLPSIRRHGGYLKTNPEDSPEIILSRAVLLADATIKDLQARLQGMEAQAIADQPKVAFAEALEASPACISVGQLAKLINQATGRDVTGRDRLCAWLRAKGWLMSAPGRDYNKPTQKAVSRGYLESKTYLVKDVMGNVTAVNHTPVITGKGQRYFIGLFRLAALERRNPH